MREVTDEDEVFKLLSSSEHTFQLPLQPSTNFGSTYSLYILHSHMSTRIDIDILKAMAVLSCMLHTDPVRTAQ